MSKIAELRKAIKETAGEIRKHAERIHKQNKSWTEEAKKAYDEANTRYDKLAQELRDEEEAASVEARMNKINEDEQRSTRHGRQMPGLDDTIPGEDRTYGEAGMDRDEARAFAQREADKRQALRSFLIRDAAPHLINEEMRSACERLKFYPDQTQLRCSLLQNEDYWDLQERVANRHASTRRQEIREMAKATATAGAELVPTTFIASIELAMLAYGPMLAYVDTLTTKTGEPMTWPVGDDTGNEGATVAENTDVGAAVDPTLSNFTLSSWEYHSKFIKVSFALTRDSLVNIDLLVGQMIGERLGRILTKHATIGDGSSKIKGINSDAALGKTTASATAITTDELIDLQQSVDMAYRSRGMWMMHDNIIGVIRKLKDTTGRYLWESNIAVGRPDTIYGQTLIPNQYMASTVATTNLTALYGDMSYYKYRRVGNITVLRLMERFAEKLQTGYLGYLSADGKLLRPNATTSCPVKKLVQA